MRSTSLPNGIEKVLKNIEDFKKYEKETKEKNNTCRSSISFNELVCEIM